MAYNTKLYRSTGSTWEEVRVGSEWGMIANKPTNFPPTAHSHPEYVKTSGNQTITGIKQIDNSDLRMNGGSVSYLRPVTTGGWARGFWWQKNATDDVPYQRIGGIGVLGNNLSVSKFYIGYGESPWTNSILEAFPDYVNINGTLRTIATSDSDSDNTVATKGYVDSKITSGVFPVDRIPDLDASKITSGTFATSRIPDLHASKITTGIFNIDRIPTLPTSKIQELDLILSGKAPKTMPLYTTTADVYTSSGNYHNAIVVINSSYTRYVYIDSDTEGTYAPPGTQITVIRKGSGNVVISTSGGTKLAEGSKSYINERYQAVTLIKDSVANTWFVVGALR